MFMEILLPVSSIVKNNSVSFQCLIHWVHARTKKVCPMESNSEGFFVFFYVDEEREYLNTPKSESSSASWLGSFVIYQGIRTTIATYSFVIFQGGGVLIPCAHLWIRAWSLSIKVYIVAPGSISYTRSCSFNQVTNFDMLQSRTSN